MISGIPSSFCAPCTSNEVRLYYLQLVPKFLYEAKSVGRSSKSRLEVGVGYKNKELGPRDITAGRVLVLYMAYQVCFPGVILEHRGRSYSWGLLVMAPK